MPENLLSKLKLGVLTGLITGIIISTGTRIDNFILTDLLDRYEFHSYDARMKKKAEVPPAWSEDDVVIVDIDQTSIMELGSFLDWPQAYHGQLIDVLSSGDARGIVFDIIFDQKDSSDYYLVKDLYEHANLTNDPLQEEADNFLLANDPDRLVSSTLASQKVYHTLVFERSDPENYLYDMDKEPEGYDYKNHILAVPKEQAVRFPTAARIGNTYMELLSAAKGAGAANFPQDKDGITRRAPTALYFKGPGHVYPTLTMAAIMDILDIPQDGFAYDFENSTLRLTNRSGKVVRTIPIDDKGRMFVNFYGSYKTFNYIPYSYAFNPEMLDPLYWKDKVALVGSSLPGLMDLRNTPVQETFAGVEIHANVLQSILRNEFVKMQDRTSVTVVIILLSIALSTIFSLTGRPFLSLPILMLAGGGWIFFAYYEFLTNHTMLEIVRPLLAMGIVYLTTFLTHYLFVEKDKRFLRSSFSTYISPALIEEMYKSKQEPKLGGAEGYNTALFSDIQGFSSFSEKLSPSELVELLNEYMTAITDIVLESRGTLDKYIGDAMIAFFGAPAPVANHEYQACLAALKMQEKLSELRKGWKATNREWPEEVYQLQTRIGINSGLMVTGNMGSKQRMNYTMMGDSVNLAARLESAAKQYGVFLVVGEPTYNAVKDEFVWRELDYLRVVGRTEPVKIFELISLKDSLTESYNEILPAFQEALALYRDGAWESAKRIFLKIEKKEKKFPGRKTNPSAVYIQRCTYFGKNAPPENWRGVWVMKTK